MPSSTRIALSLTRLPYHVCSPAYYPDWQLNSVRRDLDNRGILNAVEEIRALEALVAMLEGRGLLPRASRLCVGAVTVELSASRLPDQELTPASDDDDDKRNLEALLWSTGADATPFLRST